MYTHVSIYSYAYRPYRPLRWKTKQRIVFWISHAKDSLLPCDEPFDLKPQRKRMAKLKYSTCFHHISSNFSSNFLQVFQMTKLNCFHHRSANVCKNTGKGKTFCSHDSFLCKNASISAKAWIGWRRSRVAPLVCQPIHGFGCVAHKRIYSHWLQRYMMPSVFCSYPAGKKCHSNRKETPLVRLFLKAPAWKQTVDHCASGYYPPP